MIHRKYHQSLIQILHYPNSIQLLQTDINTDHEDEDLISIKKVYHPIYGESLLSADRDKVIKLWAFE